MRILRVCLSDLSFAPPAMPQGPPPPLPGSAPDGGGVKQGGREPR